MKKDFARVRLSPEGFVRLSQQAVDGAFPKTYEEWEALVREGELLAHAAGLEPDPLELNVEFFLSWCRLTGVLPCLPALRAFIIVEREGIHSGLHTLSPPR